jgi:hypothetical protein
MEETFSATLKSVGAMILTLVLFLGVGYYVYTALFVPPGPQPDEFAAASTSAPSQTR